MSRRREYILSAADDLATDLVSYDRKGDEDLPPGSIQRAISVGEVTREEIVRAFSVALARELGA